MYEWTHAVSGLHVEHLDWWQLVDTSSLFCVWRQERKGLTSFICSARTGKYDLAEHQWVLIVCLFVLQI